MKSSFEKQEETKENDDVQNEIHLLLVTMISEANEHASLRRAYLTKSAAYLKFKRREKLTALKIMILSHHFFKKI